MAADFFRASNRLCAGKRLPFGTRRAFSIDRNCYGFLLCVAWMVQRSHVLVPRIYLDKKRPGLSRCRFALIRLCLTRSHEYDNAVCLVTQVDFVSLHTNFRHPHSHRLAMIESTRLQPAATIRLTPEPLNRNGGLPTDA